MSQSYRGCWCILFWLFYLLEACGKRRDMVSVHWQQQSAISVECLPLAPKGDRVQKYLHCTIYINICIYIYTCTRLTGFCVARMQTVVMKPAPFLLVFGYWHSSNIRKSILLSWFVLKSGWNFLLIFFPSLWFDTSNWRPTFI